MGRPNSKSKKFLLQNRDSEKKEIELLESWIAFGKPDKGFNTLALDPPPPKSPIGRLTDGSFSSFAGADKFFQLPISKKTKQGLGESNFFQMTDVQRASLPHSLCGDRDILGDAKTGSGKTLAFVIPVLEKLYRARWGPEDGVGCIIMSPTRELAGQLFQVLNSVGKKHSFSAGLLIGGRKDIDTEKERVNSLNILVCTPGRLLQHMDETPDFDCSSLQILVLDEADRILDIGFKKDVNAIISQLPKERQTLLFSATQTKSVEDLARLGLKDPEYIGLHEVATPNRLQQMVMVVPLDQKLNMLWSFVKAQMNSRILVFLSSCKQVKFVYEAFKKLRPGVPLKCLYGKMKLDRRMGIYKQFCQKQSILFSTDVASRGLDFNKAVDWVVQVDCPEDVASYIHRVGRTARYLSGGKSVLFLIPSETKMVDKLREKKIPIQTEESNKERFQPVSGLLAALLVKYPNLQQLAQRSFITYLRSIYKQKDKEVFDVNKLPIDEFSASLGLPMTPKIRFLKQKGKGKKESENSTIVPESTVDGNTFEHSKQNLEAVRHEETEMQEAVFLNEKDTLQLGEENVTDLKGVVPGTRVLKKKKLKINVNRPLGTRSVFDEEGNTLPPLARLANMNADVDLDKDKVFQRYAELREKMKVADKEDKALDRQRRKEMRIKKKTKLKRGRDEEEDGDAESGDDLSGSDREAKVNNNNKKAKIYFDSDDDDDGESKKNMGSIGPKPITLAEQEELAIKLLNSMHS